MSSDAFISFQKFNDPALAEIVAEQLHTAGIDCRVEKEYVLLDNNIIGNDLSSAIHVKIAPSDFQRANSILENYYQSQLQTMDPDYYLFSFTNNELLEIIQKPDEWGQLDHALAKKLLAERGHEVTPGQIEQFQRQRITELSKTESTHPVHLFFGYFTAIFGGFFGFVFGSILMSLTKTLPDGQRTYVYPPSERRHGKCILVISAISFVFWWGVFFREKLAIWMNHL